MSAAANFPAVSCAAFSLIKQLPSELPIGESVLTKIKDLSKEDYINLLTFLSDAYHNSESPVSDAVYDLIESIYTAKYGKWTNVGAPPHETSTGKKPFNFNPAVKPSSSKTKSLDSATGSRPSGSKPSVVPLPTPMFGLAKHTDEHGLGLYKKKYEKTSSEFVVTDKLDGVSVNYRRSASGEEQLLKRGDENEGTDISYLLPYIDHPTNLKCEISVRCELLIPVKTFESKYKTDKANTRNMVAGLTNSKTFVIDEIKDIHMVAYHIYSGKSIPQTEQLAQLQHLGFKTPGSCTFNIEDLTVEDLTSYIKARKNRSDYDIDGVVICANLPITLPIDKVPEHVVAFKIQGETAVTTVREVIWEVSKHGLLKPQVKIDPVHLDGVTISSLTGNNGRFVQEYGLGPGASIVITRSGGVIPKILETVKKVEPQMPDREYRWTENDKSEKVEVAVPDGEECEEQTIKKIVAYFKEMGVDYLAQKTVEKLYNGGLCTLTDFFDADIDTIVEIEGFQKKGAERIIANIRTAIKDVSIHKIMAASGFFPGLGAKRLKQIMDTIDYEGPWETVTESLKKKYEEDILGIKGFKKLALVFVDGLQAFNVWLQNHPQIELGNSENDDEGDKTESLNEETGTTLKDQTIVFSGTRADSTMQRKIEKLGGRITSAVSNKTTILVVKDTSKVTDKVKKAQERGTRVISLDDFVSEFNL